MAGVAIGNGVVADDTFSSSFSTSGNLTFTGTGNRIRGDFTNGTIDNRVMFQTSTTNGVTIIGAIPNGTGAQTYFNAFSAVDADNSSFGRFHIDASTGTSTDHVGVDSQKKGTGTLLPIDFQISGATKARIFTNGNIGIGSTTDDGTNLLQVNGATKITGRATTASGINRALRVVTASGAITVTTADDRIIVNKTIGAATTINLPNSPSAGDEYTFKDGKGDANINNITIVPSAGNIDGAANYIMSVSRQALTIVYDGTQWEII